MIRLLIPLLWAMLLVTANRGTVRAQVSEQDSLALAAFYNATDGPNWTDNTNWLTTPVSEWNGVTVTGDRVTRLSLGWNQLTGSIPPELGKLTGLTELSLYFNQLTGEIPVELGNLANLTELDVSINQLTGEIPMELGSLDNLTLLDLNRNQLTGEIPVELGNLIDLTHLVLFNNQLTGEIPVELGNLPGLEDLALGGNKLSGSIPLELGNLPGLTYLDLEFNQLTGEIPVELGNLVNLTHLDLDFNQLTGEIPVELGNLANLTYLELSGNTSLSGTLPMSLTNLSMLEHFWFENTGLCEPVDPAFQSWLQGINDLRSTGCTNVATEEKVEIPAAFALEANYPNPFNPTTTITYALPQAADVSLTVNDVLGRQVTDLASGPKPAGTYEVTFDATGLPSGVYFYRLTAGDYVETKRMVMVK